MDEWLDLSREKRKKEKKFRKKMNEKSDFQ